LLRIEIGKLRALLEQHEKTILLNQEKKLPALNTRRYDEIEYLLEACCYPARVIYRDPGSWSSTLWIKGGEETNRLLERPIFQKNSPVIVGRSVVGVIDYIGKKQSRIRLITDAALNPSVRAARGYQQNAFLVETIETLLRHLMARHDSTFPPAEKGQWIALLKTMKEKCLLDGTGSYLAKGVLQGATAPRCRSVNHTLRGIGFNYDFSDQEGPARDLVTGGVMEGNAPSTPLPIIQQGDLLVTTGMDGVFPAGLRVAEVTKIFPLREGAYTYEIEACPVVGNLDTLQTVFIIPPVGYFQIEEDL
jgi:rod shape-determining protein MreC